MPLWTPGIAGGGGENGDTHYDGDRPSKCSPSMNHRQFGKQSDIPPDECGGIPHALATTRSLVGTGIVFQIINTVAYLPANFCRLYGRQIAIGEIRNTDVMRHGLYRRGP